MIELLLLFVGIIVGVLITYFLMHKLLDTRYKIMLEKWKLSFADGFKKQVLDRSRAVLKGKISEQIVAMLPSFKHHPADARFLGNPIDYIIFDGYTEGKPVELVFMEVKKGKHARLSRQEKRIKDAVDKKKVKWRTLNLD